MGLCVYCNFVALEYAAPGQGRCHIAGACLRAARQTCYMTSVHGRFQPSASLKITALMRCKSTHAKPTSYAQLAHRRTQNNPVFIPLFSPLKFQQNNYNMLKNKHLNQSEKTEKNAG